MRLARAGEARYSPGLGTMSEPGIFTEVVPDFGRATLSTVIVWLPTTSTLVATASSPAVRAWSGRRSVWFDCPGRPGMRAVDAQLERMLRSGKAWAAASSMRNRVTPTMTPATIPARRRRAERSLATSSRVRAMRLMTGSSHCPGFPALRSPAGSGRLRCAWPRGRCDRRAR